MSPETIGVVAGVVGAIASVVACVQAAAAKRAAIEVKSRFESLQIQLAQITTNLTHFSHSPMSHFLGSAVQVPGASGGAGGHGGVGGGGGGGGGGSVFGAGGSGGGTGNQVSSPTA